MRTTSSVPSTPPAERPHAKSPGPSGPSTSRRTVPPTGPGSPGSSLRTPPRGAAWENAPPSGARVRAAQIPLLFESEWRRDWDLAVTVETSDEEVRLARLAERGLSREEALARIASQLPASRREALADVVVRNDGSVDALRALARRLVQTLSTNPTHQT